MWPWSKTAPPSKHHGVRAGPVNLVASRSTWSVRSDPAFRALQQRKTQQSSYVVDVRTVMADEAVARDREHSKYDGPCLLPVACRPAMLEGEPDPLRVPPAAFHP